jgi:tetratricopeptide (TPR) repeat protein
MRAPFLLIVLICSLAASVAAAQSPGTPIPVPRSGDAPAVAKAPRPAPLTREQRLERLFERLAKASSAEQAKSISNAIEAVWIRSGSDTVDLLMSRAGQIQKKDNDAAIALLDRIIVLNPAYSEGWNKRATLLFIKKDYGASIRDIREVLLREPRHYGAWLGLARILEEFGAKKKSLEAYRKVLALNPKIEGIDKTMRSLAIEVEGREI